MIRSLISKQSTIRCCLNNSHSSSSVFRFSNFNNVLINNNIIYNNNTIIKNYDSLSFINKRSYCKKTTTENIDISKKVEEQQPQQQPNEILVDLNKQQEQPQQTTENKEIKEGEQQQQKEQDNNNNNENKEGDEQQQQEQQGEKRKERTFKEKLISKLKWGSFFTVLGGTITFLFYESHLRSSLPYRMAMRAVNASDETLKLFGGKIQPLSWTQCFERPIKGYVTIKEGGTDCEAYLAIPIDRYVPQPLKEGEVLVELPEEEALKGFDGGAQQGYIYATFIKRSSWFFDWKIHTLVVDTDNDHSITVIDKTIYMPSFK
ncbi:hypothetical protein PPL_00152 [Heterostelium album PN500]|uniref:Uncharacterized protein n=1 Tax=Heterostelium pallidum (strain ATCC 26659 / Pp 5 / PN500) TaxID=670386 RepID=D3AVN7_HETP5|nr:hypothetical protein PPL_00152 [Heterostelium album PN500]EFA86360.1 hypothetical protein PPL_00152 [Heterostelium album PN500]|eukprot:XP_020438465.1 hypothetical protein PPL_00152 [Heterostelium album PN500]